MREPCLPVLLLAGVVGGLLGGCQGAAGGPPVDKNTAVTPETHTGFPIATGFHGGIDCDACHGAFDSFQQFDCLGCHPQAAVEPLHVGIPGFAWASPQCRACHPDGTRLVDHALLFPIATGDTHAGIDCATCHLQPGNRKVFDCLSCHTQAKTDPWHPGVPGYAWSSPQCYACHPRSNIPDFPHPAFPIGAGFSHAQAGCRSCHTDQANLRAINCVGCHTATPTATQHLWVGGYSSTTAGCLRCHGDSQVNPVLTHRPFLIAGTTDHFKESCLRCHPGMRADKPFAADFKSLSCATCHPGIHNGQYPAPVTCLQSGCHPNGKKP